VALAGTPGCEGPSLVSTSFLERRSVNDVFIDNVVGIPFRLTACSLLIIVTAYFLRTLMGDVNEYYRAILQHKAEMDASLASMESSAESPPISAQQRLAWLVKEFSRLLELLRVAVKSLDSKTRLVWDTRVSRFEEDLRVIRSTCDRRLGLLFKAQRQQEDRDLLFQGNRDGTSSQQDQLLPEASSLRASNNMLDAITDQSKAILDGILGQNASLKNARGKLYSLINNAGLGNTMANTIHSRERADALILYACMAFTLVVFFLLWWLVR
jgi:hypothetical protein